MKALKAGIPLLSIVQGERNARSLRRARVSSVPIFASVNDWVVAARLGLAQTRDASLSPWFREESSFLAFLNFNNNNEFVKFKGDVYIYSIHISPLSQICRWVVVSSFFQKFIFSLNHSI